MHDVINQHIQELSKLPKEYAIHLALNNNDIINNVIPYNAKRLDLFMYHCIHKIPDKIRIVEYTTDDYPMIGILENYEYIIIYTLRIYKSKDALAEFESFYGTSMNRNYRKYGYKLIRDYYLVTYNHGEIPVFSELL